MATDSEQKIKEEEEEEEEENILSD